MNRHGSNANRCFSASRQKCALQLEQELQNKLTQQEQQFAARRQQLEQDTNQRKQQLEHELLEIQQKQAEQHKINQRNALQELETIRRGTAPAQGQSGQSRETSNRSSNSSGCRRNNNASR